MIDIFLLKTQLRLCQYLIQNMSTVKFNAKLQNVFFQNDGSGLSSQ